jgi:hypothetical protein
LIRDDHPRRIGQPLQELAEESLRRRLVPPALHQDIEDMTILIHGPPQVMALFIDGQEDFIEMLRVAGSRTLAP